MRSNKILDVSEDDDRVYFSFYKDNYNAKIIGLPKKECMNKAIYAGTSFDELRLVENENVGEIFNALMLSALSMHPAMEMCDVSATKLIGLTDLP